MASITKQSIDEVKSRVDIYSVVSNYVSLKRSGASYKGLSPFTTEKTPSFFVNPDKAMFYCFSTSQGGDIFTFIQKKENMTFPEAVELLASRYGITLEYEEGKGKSISSSLKKQVLDINELACNFFCENFLKEENEAIREYWLKERNFSLDDAKKMRIGFAPIDWSRFKNMLKNNFSQEAINNCGLFFGEMQNGDISRLNPRFRGRLMIAICNIHSQVIAFTARKTALTPDDIDYEQGKYVNSPETVVFSKKNTLFNLDKARQAESAKSSFILVEGQLDAIRMYLNGFENTVAGQGTAIGQAQLMTLKRYASRIVLLLDSDLAGQKAALRLIPICLACELDVQVACLEEGQDPDSLIVNFGAEKMRQIIENAENAIKFVSDKLFRDLYQSSSQGKLEALSSIYEIISSSSSKVLQDDYLRVASTSIGADYSSVSRDFSKYLADRQRYRQNDFSPEQKKYQDNQEVILTNAEYDALLLFLHNDKIGKILTEIISCDWVNTESLAGKLLARFISAAQEGIDFKQSNFDLLLENDVERNFIYRILSMDNVAKGDILSLAKASAEKIWKKYCQKHIDTINKKLQINNIANEEMMGLVKELSKWRKSLGNYPWKFE
ncbi:MAG: DNA primase [Opitutales bacterium]